MKQLLSVPDVIVDDNDIVITVARDEEKIAAVLYCMANTETGHTIRSVRECATRYTPVGERMVKRIIRVLAYDLFLVRYDTKLRKWVPNPTMPQFSNIKQALEFVIVNGIRFR